MEVSRNIFKAINTYSLISPEMKNYSHLSLEKEDEVLRATFLRIFNAFWGINDPHTFVKVDNTFRAERMEQWQQQLEEATFAARKHPNSQTDYALLQVQLAKPEIKSVPEHDLIIRANRKAGYQVEFYMQAIFFNDDFSIICVGSDADAPEEVNQIEKKLMKVIDDLLNFTVNAQEDYFMKHFFNELHQQNLSIANGDDIGRLNKIYKTAMEIYPDFARAPLSKRIEIMETGLKKAYRSSRQNRDIYVLAKCCFEALHNAGMIDTMKYSGNTYHKIKGYYRTRCNPDKPSEIWERHCLIFVEYEYSINGCTFRNAIHASELWLALTRGWEYGEGKETA